MGDRVFTGWINTAGSVETSNTCLPFQHELDEVMFINVNSVSSPTPTSRVPNAAFWVTLRRDKVHGEEAAHITPPHKSFCNIHNILQDLRRNVHNPVCPVSYRNHLIPVLCN